jgi:hypothetical protein
MAAPASKGKDALAKGKAAGQNVVVGYFPNCKYIHIITHTM